ncbi:MAG: outer membrane lipoprotein chaperone LolA [Marinobacter sp.]|uniref:outer membrane lipoprotein chaperone LolA n=1 Tax=Marinobacter sp. TaxID=50741 RepID=UPI00299DAECC|nr:outer membrane lipoprotein chaperone LolA [Marinobacter sp.]MDX1633119.1 outer membrane lipoprotein chaperone LolA [Marinobacter sp.]
MRIMQNGVLALALMLMAGLAVAQDDSAAARLADELSSYRTFQADFVQTVMDAQGDKLQESRGSLKAKRPGLFYWHSEQPMAQYIVADGEVVKVYDPDLEQVTIQAMDQKVSSTPALLLSGQVDNLAQTYEVSYRTFGDKTVEYTLVPRDPDSLFTSLTLTFYQGELQEMRLSDSLEQRSLLSFDDVVINAEIPDSAFELDYPDNVDVIQGNG